MLLIVMFETGTWWVRPGDRFTFGRDPECTLVLPQDDLGISRTAGSLTWSDAMWWLSNDSASSMLYLSADLGFRVDLPPRKRVPVEEWHARVRLNGALTGYTLRLRLPDLDADNDDAEDDAAAAPAGSAVAATTMPRAQTSTRHRAPLTESDRLVLAARFVEYLNWRQVGEPAPRSAR